MKTDELLAKLIARIESGCPPWRREWSGGGESGLPRNVATGREYTGMNIPIFWLEQGEFGYETPLWIGYKQAQDLGGHVRKGERGHDGVRMNVINKKDESGNKTGDVFQLPTSFKVWNIDQCEGLDHLKPPVTRHEWTPIQTAESILTASGATIEYGGGRAYYAQTHDKITLPERNRFMSAEGFYATALHELGHWTGHESRLNRQLKNRFGDDSYAMEELVAEMSCCFTQARIGLGGDVENHASYLDVWLRVLKEKPSILLSLSAQASRAADYIYQEKPDD